MEMAPAVDLRLASQAINQGAYSRFSNANPTTIGTAAAGALIWGDGTDGDMAG